MFGHSGAFPVPPHLHFASPPHGVEAKPAPKPSTSPKPAASSSSRLLPSSDRRQRVRTRTLPSDIGEEVTARKLRKQRTLQIDPVVTSDVLEGSHLVDMIKSLTEQCSIEELRIQTLQGTIRHKMSEYPIVSARMSEIDHQAIDLYNTLMDSQPVPVDTSPTFRPFDLPSPSSVEAESDIDGYVASRGSDATRASAVRPSAPALLNDFTVHLEKAEQEVKESKMNMLEREEKLRKAGAVLGRDQEIIAELERRIQQRKHDIAAIRARQQMQNIALLSAAIVGCIAICVAAVIFSLRQDGEQT